MDSAIVPVIGIIIILLFALAAILNHEVFQYMLKASQALAALNA